MSKSKSTTNIPGIYIIRNILNGKVYIGQSKNIRKRFNQYRWAVNTDAHYKETTHPITIAMREDGIENFEFNILFTDDNCEDPFYRAEKEIEFIAKYQSTDPKYGYNSDMGGNLGHLTPRPQKIAERIKRAKPLYRYDIKTGGMLLYIGGAKSVGDDMGYSKDVMSHTVKRGSLLEGRYYLIPVDPDKRKELLYHIKSKKSKSKEAYFYYTRYKEACDIVDKISKDIFGI